MKRDNSIDLRLSNVLYKFDEFYNRCVSELDMTDLVEEGLNEAYDKWSDCLESDEFVPKHYPDQALEILEFCMDEFGYFKNIFDYSVAQINDLAPGMILEKYSEILPVLQEKYELNQPDTIGVGGYDVDFDSYGNDSEVYEDTEIEMEDYIFSPGEFFNLHDMWKDGDEGSYEVMEDRGDRVLAKPTWKTGMSIVPQDVIKKTMIKEIVEVPEN